MYPTHQSGLSAGVRRSSSISAGRSPEATRLTIVADPNHLLAEQEILSELCERGFDLVPFTDHVVFRFAYESRYRQIWDQGEKTNLVIVLRSASGDVDALPYDLLEQARRQERCLSFSVGQLFPQLEPNVVLGLDRSCFDVLFAAQAGDDSTRLGIDATKDFVLRHVFEITPELIKTPANLLQTLLRFHYRGLSLPTELDERFIQLLNKDSQWKEWPLAEIVPNRSAFLAFVNERWPSFVRQKVEIKGDVVVETATAFGFHFSGPQNLPFGHDDVKVYIDNLFQEGQLKPVDGYNADQVPEPWMRLGMASSSIDDRAARFERLLARLQAEFPSGDAGHREWISFARTWGEWSALRWQLADAGIDAASEVCEQLHDRIEIGFANWMLRNYGSLHNLSPFHHPAMVHHIPQHMAYSFRPTGAKAAGSDLTTKQALIVVDGLAFDQWVVLRNILLPQMEADVRIDQDASFAWVPTLTGVSRQAIFAGTEPLYLFKSLGSTSTESNLWRRFWEDKGAKRVEIGYVREGKGQADDVFLAEVFKAAEHPKMRILGVVVSKIDQQIHGITTGSSGMMAFVKHWAKTGTVGRLLNRLIALDYELIVTSDHGNIHCYGIGKPKVGVIANERGERAHVFKDHNTRADAAKDYPAAIIWPQIGLPETWHAVLASGRGAFLPTGKQTVCHGGIGMEEVIVPFVKIKRILY